MKATKLQAAFARRREIDQNKIDKNAEVDKYFDKWDRITTRYEQWTTPEYYKLADDNWKLNREKLTKENLLEKRREKLQKLFDEEKLAYEVELNDLNRTKSKRLPTKILCNLEDDLRRREEEKRRLRLESQLYKKWRYGFLEDSILLESKTDNEALAKINWLDRQIENQLEKEKLQKENEERQLRLREETRKNDELLRARVLQRDEELKELKLFQEIHMAELKAREQESQNLQEKEIRLKEQKLETSNELSKLKIHVVQRNERIMMPYNLRRIKMLLRDRSDAIRRDLKFDIELLGRVALHSSSEKHELLREQFENQYDMEIQRQTQIESMYESEAKVALLKQQEIWLRESQARERLLKDLLREQIDEINSNIVFVQNRQKELLDLRETHRQAIDNANERLKDLLGEQMADENRFSIRLNGKHSSNSEELNEVVDALEKSVHNGALTINSETCRPKFGRKKVAWT